MKITYENFPKFIDGIHDYDIETKAHTELWLRAANMDVGGGKISRSDIDNLEKFPCADTLTISGLDQETFEYFIIKYGKQIKAIRFFKNKLVEDLTLLATLKNLEYVYFFHNQRVTSLWDMSENILLKGLFLSDFTRLHSLSGIERAPNLEWFGIGDAIWETTVIHSLKNCANTNIRYLSFTGKKIEEDDLSFLLNMKNLETFDFSTNLFTTNQVAWIAANCPDISGFSITPYRETMLYNEKTNENNIPAVIIIGKRKPCLKIDGNEKRIQNYIKSFKDMVEEYKDKPYSATIKV